VSSSFSPASTAGSTSSLPSSGTSSTAGATDVKPTESMSGSAGFFFWESWDGYRFKSVDSLCAGPVKDTFNYKLARVEGNTDTGRNILEFQYSNEVDVLKKMRYGTYNSMMVFFNPSTGRYEEYTFDIEKSYKAMKHLGKDEKIPEGPKELSKYPTRIMTQFIDHETFHNGTDIASPDPKDNSGSGTNFPDFKKYYAAQSVSRSLLIGNQQLNVTIAGNLTLRAGDKITILLPKFSVEEKKSDSRYDKQHSGTYLIKDISYEFYIEKSGQRNLTISNLLLVRDSFGVFNLDL
jgi:hypothetical protein